MGTIFSSSGSGVAMLGTATLFVAFLVAAYSALAGIVGQRSGRKGLVESALWASWAFTALMCFASCLMVYAFLSHDFRIKYVAHYSDTTMPLFYLLAAYWGGLDGSLMFWVWILSGFSAVALFVNRHRHRDMLGYVIATIAGVSLFFLALLLYSKNPFATFLTGAPAEGKGLNPLLQNYWMAIHPPSLYIGYVGMTIPFAFCMGALASGRLDDSWLHSVRVWVIIPWFFLGLGLILGGLWAYEELGWGGYWAWDPVENAGLIPWFTATAFLHSIQMQERRGMLKVWNVVLMITTFFLTIFGTFMTRSGIVQSVHAFGQDNELALLFLIFMAVLLLVSFGLTFYRLPALRSAGTFDSLASREFAFLLNNILLLISAFFVLFATMFPTISEYVMQQRITVGQPFFNRFMVPIALCLLLLTGVGPLLAWRSTRGRRLLDQFLFPTLLGIATIITLWFAWPPSRARQEIFADTMHVPLALICFGLVAFTVGAIAQEFWRGMRVRRAQTGNDPFTSLLGIVLAKRRKYGGYIVHLGIAVMFFGFIGKAYSRDKSVTVGKLGESFEVGPYKFTYEELSLTANDNRDMATAKLGLWRNDERIATMYPARWFYKIANQEVTSEVFIDRGMGQDVYAVMNTFEADSNQANFTIFINPLVNFVWLGFGVMVVGTIVCLLPAGLGRGRQGAAAAALLVFGLVAGSGGTAQAQGMAAAKHEVVEGSVEDHAGAPPIAIEIWKNLVCLCGGCQRESLRDCRCAVAKKEREHILAMLEGRDISTKDGQKKIYDEVLAEYVGRFGGNHVLTVPPDSAFNRLAWAVPYAVFGGALMVAAFVGRVWVRRGRKAQAATVAANGKPDGRNKYDDKLDQELDELDE